MRCLQVRTSLLNINLILQCTNGTLPHLWILCLAYIILFAFPLATFIYIKVNDKDILRPRPVAKKATPELQGFRWESNSRPRESSATLCSLVSVESFTHSQNNLIVYLYKLLSVKCQYYSLFTSVTLVHLHLYSHIYIHTLVLRYFSPYSHVPWAPRLCGPRALSYLIGQNDKCKSENKV